MTNKLVWVFLSMTLILSTLISSCGNAPNSGFSNVNIPFIHTEPFSITILGVFNTNQTSGISIINAQIKSNTNADLVGNYYVKINTKDHVFSKQVNISNNNGFTDVDVPTSSISGLLAEINKQLTDKKAKATQAYDEFENKYKYQFGQALLSGRDITLGMSYDEMQKLKQQEKDLYDAMNNPKIDYDSICKIYISFSIVKNDANAKDIILSVADLSPEWKLSSSSDEISSSNKPIAFSAQRTFIYPSGKPTMKQIMILVDVFQTKEQAKKDLDDRFKADSKDFKTLNDMNIGDKSYIGISVQEKSVVYQARFINNSVEATLFYTDLDLKGTKVEDAIAIAKKVDDKITGKSTQNIQSSKSILNPNTKPSSVTATPNTSSPVTIASPQIPLTNTTPSNIQGTKSPIPILTLTYPKGGEIWHVGDTVTITWTSTNLPKEALIFIDINTTDTARVGISEPRAIPNTGSYKWKVVKSIDSYSIIGTNKKITLGCGVSPYSLSDTHIFTIVE